MFGLLVGAQIEAGREDDAIAYLNDRVIPQIKQTPGFVAGYWWTDSAGGRGITIYETEENAKAAAEMATSGQVPPPEYVSMGKPEIVEITNHA